MAQKLSNFVQFMMEPDDLAEYEKRVQADEMQQGSVDAVAKARELMRARQTAKGDIGARQQLENLAALPLDFSQMQREDAGNAMAIDDAPTMQGQQTARNMRRLGELQDMAPEQLLGMQDTAAMSDRDIMEQQGLSPGGRFGETSAAQAFRKDVTGDIGMFDAKKQEISDRQTQRVFGDKIELANSYKEFLSKEDPKLTAALEYAIGTATPENSKLVDELIKEAEKSLEGRRTNQNELTGQEQSLRQQYIGLSKDFKSVEDAYNRIEMSGKNPSPAGDLALIFNFMKLLDPGSTVREGEFANAENSGGVTDRVRNMYNRLLSGERLAINRDDFLSQAKNLYSAQLQQQSVINGKFSNIAQRGGMNPENIVIFGNQQQRPTSQQPRTSQTQGSAGGNEYDDIVRKYGAAQ